MKKEPRRTLHVFEMSFSKKISGVTRKDRRRNVDIMKDRPLRVAGHRQCTTETMTYAYLFGREGTCIAHEL